MANIPDSNTIKAFMVTEDGELLELIFNLQTANSIGLLSNGVDATGKKINQLNMNNLDATIKFANGNSNTEYILIGALFDDGVLVDAISISDKQGTSFEKQHELKFRTSDKAFNMLKIFMVDNLEKVTPLCEAYVIGE